MKTLLVYAHLHAACVSVGTLLPQDAALDNQLRKNWNNI
jgi:hypothetical protein